MTQIESGGLLTRRFLALSADMCSDYARALIVAVIPGWCASTRPQMRNCASGNLEIPGSMLRIAPE